MSEKISLTAEIRTDVGKGASRRLRRTGEKIPAIIYGDEQSPLNLTLASNEVTKAMESETFYSQILNVVVDGSSSQAVVRDMQRNPASNKVMHIDFQRISANKIMHVNVPLHFINEEQCVGVKIEGGIIAHNIIEVEISCLPADLPEFIEVDMAEIGLGYGIHLSGLSLPKGVTIVALTHGEDHDITVVAVNARKVVTEEEEDSVVEAAPAGDAEAADDAAEDSGDDE